MAQAPRQSRQRVLDAALRLFSERGYGGTALQAIADELGLTKASVYYYFAAKGDLVEALAQPCLARLEAVVIDASDAPDLAGCRAVVAAYLDVLAGDTAVAALLIGDPTVASLPAAARCRALRGSLRDLLARAGSPPVGSVQATCALGAVQTAVFDLPASDTAGNAATIVDAAMRALDASPSGA
jgi:AcrR family transcriptional regulator